MRLATCLVAAAWLSISFSQCGRGGDWPQILGPDRNGVAAPDERLDPQWPADGPAQLWKLPVGRGFAGVAVVGETAILFDRVAGSERVQALSIHDGSPRWTKTYSTNFVPQYGRDDGPMSVPSVADGAVVTFGAEGLLMCSELDSGKERWRHDTKAEFDALEGFFGAGSSPLIDSGKIYVNVGGRQQQAGIVCFELATGKVLWKSVEDGASYSSPIIARLGGRRRLIALTRLKCVVLDPDTGEVAAEFPYGLRGPTVTAANPLVVSDRLFLSASYGIGARLIKFGGGEPQTVWDSNDLMSSQYTTCIEHKGLLYGVDGRQDIPPASLRCFDPVSQNVKWTARGSGYATLIKADNKLLVMKTDGTLILAALDSDAYQELAKAEVFQETVRALPAFSNGRLYVRDGHTLKCLDLRADR